MVALPRLVGFSGFLHQVRPQNANIRTFEHTSIISVIELGKMNYTKREVISFCLTWVRHLEEWKLGMVQALVGKFA